MATPKKAQSKPKPKPKAAPKAAPKPKPAAKPKAATKPSKPAAVKAPVPSSVPAPERVNVVDQLLALAPAVDAARGSGDSPYVNTRLNMIARNLVALRQAVQQTRANERPKEDAQ